MATKKTPKLLVSNAKDYFKPKNWFEKLAQDDQNYIRNVVDEIRSQNAPYATVALALIIELGLDGKISAQQVARTMQRM